MTEPESREQTDARLQVALTSSSVASAHLQLAERRLRRRHTPDDVAILRSSVVTMAALGRLAPELRALVGAADRLLPVADPRDEITPDGHGDAPER